MHRGTSQNLAVSDQAFGASLDVDPVLSTEASSAVHNPYVVGFVFGRTKTIHVGPIDHKDILNDNVEAKRKLDKEPSLTKDISQAIKQTDGLFYGVYLDTFEHRFKVGILREGHSESSASGWWVKEWEGGNLTRKMVDEVMLVYLADKNANTWNAPGDTLLEHWYWYKYIIPNLGGPRRINYVTTLSDVGN